MSKKVAVVYWTGTGNTEEMAKLLEENLNDAGATAELFFVSDFSADKVADFDAFAFGCPAMGDEELEADEFEPVWDEAKAELGDKPVVLFGSYSWAEGEWMETWRSNAEEAGVNVAQTVIAFEAPDDEATEKLKAAAAVLAE